MKTDLEIAYENEMKPIKEIATSFKNGLCKRKSNWII